MKGPMVLLILIFFSIKKLQSIFSTMSGSCSWRISYFNPFIHTLSKAFLMFLNTLHSYLSLQFVHIEKPMLFGYLYLSKVMLVSSKFSKYLVILSHIIHFNIFPGISRRDIGR